MTASDDDLGQKAARIKEVHVEHRDDEALEGFLRRVHELGSGPAPLPNDRLAAVLGVGAHAPVRRLTPRRAAGASALGVALLVGTGWAAAAADQLPRPAQSAVARLTGGWLPGIPHPEDQRTGAATTPAGVLPTPTTTTVAVPSGTRGTDPQPVRQSVAPRPTGSRGDDAERSGDDDREGATQGTRESEESQTPEPSSTGTGTDDGRDDDGATGTGGSEGGSQATSGGSTAGTDDGATNTDDGDVTGSDDGQDGSGTGSTGDGADH